MAGAGLPRLHNVSDIARDEFESFLNSVPGSKELVIQSKSLMTLLEHVTPMKVLRSLQVDHIYFLESIMDTDGSIRFYLTRPDVNAMNIIVGHIKSNYKAKKVCSYHIIFVPRILASCEYILEREGVIGQVNLLNWNLNLVPLDEHVLSLEYAETARTLLLEGNYSILHSVASSLCDLESIFGNFPKIYGKGKYSQMVYELFIRMKETFGNEFNAKNTNNNSGVLTEVVLFDRTCDWITPMCSQLTYEGMLDDVFGIQCGFVELKKDVSGDAKVKVLLNEKDPVFSLIRSMHFSGVSEVLIGVSKDLQCLYDKGRDKSKSIQEMKEFVKKLPKIREKHDSLSTHLKASEQIIQQTKGKDYQKHLNTEWTLLDGSDKLGAYDHIEVSIENQANIYPTLQLLCLASTTADGIKSKYYHPFKHSFMHSYGHKHLITFKNLMKAGILKEKFASDPVKSSLLKDESASFFQLSRLLSLVPKDPASFNLRNPTSASYVFGGAYIPLSCAAISHVINKGDWIGIKDIIKNWDGPYICESTGSSVQINSRKNVLVYFIGGVTFSEINALRFMESQLNCHFIIATTDIINWQSILKSFMKMEVTSDEN